MFDESELIRRLETLPPRHRAAFAASCCERLLPNYAAFSRMENWGQPELLREALDEAWGILEGRDVPEERVRALMESCTEAVPDTEDFQSLFVSAAGDAAAAIAYTLECCLNGDTEQAATVGRLATETLYQYLTRINDPETGVHVADTAFEESMLSAPLMIAELNKQQHDLGLLESQPALMPNLLKELRASSQAAGIRPFERGLLKY
jgi:uncharacterized protein